MKINEEKIEVNKKGWFFNFMIFCYFISILVAFFRIYVFENYKVYYSEEEIPHITNISEY